MIRKAVIPVAGWGTRVLPASKTIPKPMFPIADLPAIYYVVEEAVQSGVNHIIFVTSRSMRAIEDYFDVNPELNDVLAAKESESARQMLARLRQIEGMAKISTVRQPKPQGLGHAVLMAREIVGDEPFAVMLGDDLVRNNNGAPCLRQLIDVFERQHDGSVLGVMPVPTADIARYGIIGGTAIAPRLMRINTLVEKPIPQDAPSNLAIIGRYVLTPEIFGMLEMTPPGNGNEIQLTDALHMLLRQQPIYGYTYEGTRYDTGDTLGWLTTAITYTLERPDMAPALKAYLRTLDLS